MSRKVDIPRIFKIEGARSDGMASATRVLVHRNSGLLLTTSP